MQCNLLRTTLLVAALMLPVAPAAADPPPDPALIPALINQLGHPRFSAREQAMDRLMAYDLVALAPLEACEKHPDREIRYRAARLASILRQRDFERRLALFRGEVDPAKGHGLPGWARFAKSVGPGPEARAVFIDMQRAEGTLLRRIERGENAGDAVTERVAEVQAMLQVAPQQIGLGTVATLLLLSAQDDLPLPDQAHTLIYSLSYQPAFTQAIAQPGPREPLRKLLGQWIARGKGQTLYRAVNMALQHDLKEGLAPAERLLAGDAGPVHYRLLAMYVVMRYGDATHSLLLEKWLDDATACTTVNINGKQVRTQLGDVALAGLIHLAKRNPRDFGFERAEPHATYVYNAGTLAFADDESRAAARAKWEAFCKARDAAAKTP